MPEANLKEKIGHALGRIASGVAVLTTQDGEISGAMLASWFQQASFEPPLLSFAVKRGRPMAELIGHSKKVALNILHTGQKDMIAHFGKGFEPGQDPFAGIQTERHLLGVPVLKNSLCFLEGELRQQYEVGDHQLFIVEVVNAGSEEEGQPMVHIRRNGFNY
ncbi:MAG TPA: flavin reductase family protein [Deltaproteobacteria bacterium]|nr:flavin reductase family protein [Deltaproteobacteria bacterium]